MKIIVDAMGGDNAPHEIVKGAIKAATEIDETVALIGPSEMLSNLLREYEWNGNNIEIIDATEEISNHEAPSMAVRKKKDSSIVKGLNMIKAGEGDAFISAGSTGALLAGGLVTVGRIKGIRRPAIAAWFPKLDGSGTTLLLDCGASVESKPEYLLQNGIMGAIFVNAVKGVDDPDVRLLNIGAEESKGDDLHKEAYRLLENSPVNFGGNIEGRDVAETTCDVVVCDGFSGNIFLKSSEGTALAMMNLLKTKLTEGILAKVGAGLAYGKLKEIKNIFDYSDVGGAPILGLKAPVIKSHGNSGEKEIYYAVLKAIPFVNNKVTERIEQTIEEHTSLFNKDNE
mgnify:CR=1 FL=1